MGRVDLLVRRHEIGPGRCPGNQRVRPEARRLNFLPERIGLYETVGPVVEVVDDDRHLHLRVKGPYERVRARLRAFERPHCAPGHVQRSFLVDHRKVVAFLHPVVDIARSVHAPIRTVRHRAALLCSAWENEKSCNQNCDPKSALSGSANRHVWGKPVRESVSVNVPPKTDV